MIVIPCEQGTAIWAEARRGVATASCADKIVTPAKGDFSKSDGCKDYACQLIAELMLPAHYWFGDDYVSSAMANGTNTEREARDYIAMRRDCDVEQVGFITTDDRRFGCSPDGLIGEHEGLELKCPTHKVHVRYLVDGVLPDKYKPQVHWSLLVTKRPVWNFVSYAVGLPPLEIQVEPNAYTLKVAEAMEKFWLMLAEMKAKIRQPEPIASLESEDTFF